MKRLKEIQKHTENLKLSSDEHGHDCGALREYCEQELITYAENYVPYLLERIKKLTVALESLAAQDTDGTFDGNEFIYQDAIEKLQWYKKWRYKAKDLAIKVLEEE